MENQLQIFKHENFKDVRAFSINNERWFVAKDVCENLDITNPTAAMERLDEDERSKFNLGRQGETNCVNEPGLYALVLGSRKPEAKAFKRWITHEVIPAIRVNGQYSIKQGSTLEAVRLVNQQVTILLDTVGELDNKISEVDRKVENQITLTFNQAKNVQFKISEKVIIELGGKETASYKEYSKSYFSALHRDIKKKFGVPSYRDILKKDYSLIIKFIENWIPDADIREAV